MGLAWIVMIMKEHKVMGKVVELTIAQNNRKLLRMEHVNNAQTTVKHKTQEESVDQIHAQIGKSSFKMEHVNNVWILDLMLKEKSALWTLATTMKTTQTKENAIRFV